MSHAAFLKLIPAFQSLSDEELEQLSSQCEAVRFRPDETILCRGDPGDAMYIIKQGRAVAPVLNPAGERMLLAQLRTRDYFGEMALLTGEPRTADVISRSDLECLRIAREPFLAFLKQHPAVASFLTAILGQRLLEGENIRRVGNYRIVGELGSGGVALVFEGLHTSLDIRVAVKMLSHELVFDQQFVTRFKAESRIMANLAHENIVRVLDYEEAYATFFITMEKVDGTDLQKLMRSKKPLEPATVRSILAQTARALECAHSQGIVHRDVKPGNILMEPSGRIKLMDFGIAKTMLEGTAVTGSIVGTPKYMSPEQCLALPLDGRSDIYSLGVVGFEMLTGKPPFEPTSSLELLRSQREVACLSPKSVNPELPDDLDALIRMATARDPDDRFQSALELVQFIERAPPSPAQGATRRCTLTLDFDHGQEGTVRSLIKALRDQVAEQPSLRLSVRPVDLNGD